MENTNEFLPKEYATPDRGSKYLKFAQGDNHIRLLSPAVVGWVDWKETNEGRRPVRTKDKPEKSINPEKPAKHFWAIVIWDYKEGAVKILEITQAGIQDTIFNLHSDVNWGNPTGYDLVIKREGEQLQTKYFVTPVPPKELDQEIAKVYSETRVDLEKLFTNEDPFVDVQPGADQVAKESAEIDNEKSPAQQMKKGMESVQTDDDIPVENIPF